jgi:hypothetical protein
MLEGSIKKYKKDIKKEFIAMTRETKREKRVKKIYSQFGDYKYASQELIGCSHLLSADKQK